MSNHRIPPPRQDLPHDMQHLLNVKRGKEIHVFRDRHLLPAYCLARVLCGREEAAQELVVAALDAALERSGTWPREQPLGTWLHARLIERWLLREKREGSPVREETPDRHRRGRRRRGASRNLPVQGRRTGQGASAPLSFDADGRLPGSRPPDWSGLLADESARTQLVTALEEAARHLPVRLRVAWALCDVCGHDAGEAGEILDLSGASVLSRLHRARLILRGALDGPLAGPVAAGEQS